MENSFKAAAAIIAACLTAGFAQSSNGQAIAYVYVASSTQISGYSAAATGQLTPIPELPVAARVTHLSTTSKTLFGSGSDNQNMYSFNIGAGGVLVPGPVTYVQQYNSNGCPGVLGPTQIDYSEKYLYSLVLDGDCAGGTVTHVYPILQSGALGEGDGWYTQIEYSGPPHPIRILGNNKFGFFTGCQTYGSDFTPTTLIFELGTGGFSGWLIPDGQYHDAPEPSDPDDFYCPAMLAGDPSNHLAYAFRKYYPSMAELSTPYYLASYTVDTQGNLLTDSNYTDMPAANIGTLSAMSISPAGNLLAVAGSYGFELFHFDGGNPITKIGSLVSSSPVTQVAWDKTGHLYVLTVSSLYVYTATTSGVKQAPGSPYTLSGSGPYSIIALSLTH
ncbi:MAG: hypothetical protein WBE74_03700 [Terracidiphilus sp.]